MRCRRRPARRRGVAAVEFAAVLPLMLLLLLGVWEVGRMVHVNQILTNSARQGARMAAQGQIVNVTGTYQQIHVNTGNPNVKQSVDDYMKGAGISNTAGMTVQFQFIDGNTGNTEPYQATKGQRFRVTVTLPYANVRWTTMSLLNVTDMTTSVDWVAMVDDPFQVNATIPTWNPMP